MLLHNVEIVTGGVTNVRTLNKATIVIFSLRMAWACYLYSTIFVRIAYSKL